MLAPFRERDDVHIVAGETTTPIRGPYGLAMALTFVFPRFSRDRALVPSRTYWANNVAVRRRLLEQVPIPDQFPVFRGQNIIHSARLAELGHIIWRNPGARVLHVLPTRRELPRRFFQLGQDNVNIPRFARSASGHSYRGDMAPDRIEGGRVKKLLARPPHVHALDDRGLRERQGSVRARQLGCRHLLWIHEQHGRPARRARPAAVFETTCRAAPTRSSCVRSSPVCRQGR
jgi:hypothetical protein